MNKKQFNLFVALTFLYWVLKYAICKSSYYNEKFGMEFAFDTISVVGTYIPVVLYAISFRFAYVKKIDIALFIVTNYVCFRLIGLFCGDDIFTISYEKNHPYFYCSNFFEKWKYAYSWNVYGINYRIEYFLTFLFYNVYYPFLIFKNRKPTT